MSVLSLWPFPTSWGEVYRVGTNSAFLPKTGFSREDKGGDILGRKQAVGNSIVSLMLEWSKNNCQAQIALFSK